MEKVHGIVTGSMNFRDNDKLINLFTMEEGLLFITAYGARGSKGEIAAASQPFMHGEFMLSVKNGMISLKSAVVDEPFTPIYSDYERYKIGSAMLLAINTSMTENERSEDIYALLHYCLSFLAYTDSNHWDIFSGFLLKLMYYSGFAPSITHCANCGEDLRKNTKVMFSDKAGGSLCHGCSASYNAKSVEPLTLEIMRRILTLQSCDITKIAVPQKAQKQVYSTILSYAESQLETRLFK